MEKVSCIQETVIESKIMTKKLKRFCDLTKINCAEPIFQYFEKKYDTKAVFWLFLAALLQDSRIKSKDEKLENISKIRLHDEFDPIENKDSLQ